MASSYNGVAVPADGNKIGYVGGKYSVPDVPIIPFIEGDGTGRDIWKASQRVFDAAVERPTRAGAGLPGTKSSPEKRPSPSSITGFRMTPSKLSANFGLPSKAR